MIISKQTYEDCKAIAAEYSPVIIPIMRRVLPNMIADQLISVHPMGDSSEIFKINIIKTRNHEEIDDSVVKVPKIIYCPHDADKLVIGQAIQYNKIIKCWKCPTCGHSEDGS